MSEYQIIQCTCPDQASAQNIARHLLEQRLAACVSIVPGMQSHYFWKGNLECAEEYLMLIKTTEHHYPAAEQLIIQLHPYEVPEVIAIPIISGSLSYLEWLKTSLSG